MTLQCVVLDFDGTFTDVEREAPGFASSFPVYLSKEIRCSVMDLWPEATAAAKREAPELGWAFDGRTAAPADADPYVLAACAAQKVLDHLGLFANATERSALLGRVYAAAYAHTETHFRPEAAEVLRGLATLRLPMTVVTNSTPDVVAAKLAALVPDLVDGATPALGLVGNARKFLTVPLPGDPDERFANLAEGLQVAGLSRQVLLRRGLYFDALRTIWQATGAGPATTLVCGDIYELDLALPAALGAHVHLVRRHGVHAYEEAAVQAVANDRGAVSEGLLPMLARVQELMRTPAP